MFCFEDLFLIWMWNNFSTLIYTNIRIAMRSFLLEEIYCGNLNHQQFKQMWNTIIRYEFVVLILFFFSIFLMKTIKAHKYFCFVSFCSLHYIGAFFFRQIFVLLFYRRMNNFFPLKIVHLTNNFFYFWSKQNCIVQMYLEFHLIKKRNGRNKKKENFFFSLLLFVILSNQTNDIITIEWLCW